MYWMHAREQREVAKKKKERDPQGKKPNKRRSTTFDADVRALGSIHRLANSTPSLLDNPTKNAGVVDSKEQSFSSHMVSLANQATSMSVHAKAGSGLKFLRCVQAQDQVIGVKTRNQDADDQGAVQDAN